MIEPLRFKSQGVLSFYPIILYYIFMEETVAQKLKRLCDARAAEIRQAQKEGKVSQPRFQEPESVDTGPTVEEILKDPTIVFNGQVPTEEEISRDIKRYVGR